MIPAALHRMCAYPMIISWVPGACLLDITTLVLLSKEVSLAAIASDWQGILLLALVLIPATLLGYFAGMFTSWPAVRILCGKINGAPLKTGDHVVILSGLQRGTVARVYEITTGQGGWNLARLDLGKECREKFRDIFEEYSVLKIKGSSDCSGIGSQPISAKTNRTSSTTGTHH